MRLILAAACVAAISLAFVPGADAKGCINGAIIGGVAGHMAGHGKLGAAAGCVGHHEANKTRCEQGKRSGTSGSEVIGLHLRVSGQRGGLGRILYC